jgi:hypothetical protein
MSGTGAAGATGGGAGTGAGGSVVPNPDGGANASSPLGMNDVTILVPLPPSMAAPVLLRGGDTADDGTVFVPRALYDGLVTDPVSGEPVRTLVQPYELSKKYDRLHLVAVRFDLCDRHLPGACPTDEDARMRLVFQLVADGVGAEDVGIHAFYTIRNDEIGAAVKSLRELALMAPPQAGALRTSPALSAADPAPYAAKVRDFVKQHGGEARLVRLTMNAVNMNFAAATWELRGVERRGDVFVPIPIVGSTAISEQVTLQGNPSYEVRPRTDTPPGLEGAMRQSLFDAADAAGWRAYLAALATVDNPLSQTAETVPCAACHLSTVVLNARALSKAFDPLTLPGRYTSTFDLSIAAGKSAETPNTLRALGYLGTQPMITQRVVNETAQTLAETEARYPAR